MKKKIVLSLLLLLALLLASVGCSASYTGDGRIGSYISFAPDGERVEYRLVLNEKGEGEITHYPIIGAEESEEIFFTFEGESLVLHGTVAVDTEKVIGRNEFVGNMTVDPNGKHTVELRSIDTGVPFAVFVQE